MTKQEALAAIKKSVGDFNAWGGAQRPPGKVWWDMEDESIPSITLFFSFNDSPNGNLVLEYFKSDDYVRMVLQARSWMFGLLIGMVRGRYYPKTMFDE